MQKTSLNPRKIWLGVLLLITVLAAIWPVHDPETALPKPAKTTPPGNPTAVPAIAFAPLKAAVPDKAAPIMDLFPQQSWMPPPPPQLQPAKPVAPALPFIFAGRYTEGENVTIFLMEGSQMHKVKQGDTIKGTYKIEKIEQASISLTYLPMNTTQILATGVLLP